MLSIEVINYIDLGNTPKLHYFLYLISKLLNIKLKKSIKKFNILIEIKTYR